MSESIDSHRPHRTRWLFTAAAALLLLASVGWAQQASAADPHSSGDGVLTSACGEQCDDGGGLITLSGGGAARIFTVDANATLDARNLTIADGRGNSGGLGGGILNAGTLTLTNCTFSENGGAISNLCEPRPCDYCFYCQSGSVTLTNTIIAESAGPSGDDVDVALIIQAVDNALTGCAT